MYVGSREDYFAGWEDDCECDSSEDEWFTELVADLVGIRLISCQTPEA